MSCQRCGGFLAAELAAAMYELVCGRGVIENRYCQCGDVKSPVQMDLPRAGRGALARKSSYRHYIGRGDPMIGYGKRALVVDDTETMRLLLAEALGQEGFAVVKACDAVQALCEMRKRRFDVVVTDFYFQMDWPEIPVILFSGIERDKIDLAEIRGTFAWVRKSSDPDVLLSMLALALRQGVEWEPQHAMEQVGT
jgi:hypothetical protein